MDYVYATDRRDARLSHAVLVTQLDTTEHAALCGHQPLDFWSTRRGNSEFGNCAKCVRKARGKL